WGKRSLGAAGYHVWHPEGRAFDAPPLTRFEAAARRAQRFTVEPVSPWPGRAPRAAAPPGAPHTLDPRRDAADRPPPEPEEPGEEGCPRPPSPAVTSTAGCAIRCLLHVSCTPCAAWTTAPTILVRCPTGLRSFRLAVPSTNTTRSSGASGAEGW